MTVNSVLPSAKDGVGVYGVDWERLPRIHPRAGDGPRTPVPTTQWTTKGPAVMDNVYPLKPIQPVWQWQYDGLCRTLSPDLFFHPDRERGPARRRREENAKQICSHCPVRQQCRDHALAGGESYGVWGGMSEHELREARGNNRSTA